VWWKIWNRIPKGRDFNTTQAVVEQQSLGLCAASERKLNEEAIEIDVAVPASKFAMFGGSVHASVQGPKPGIVSL